MILLFGLYLFITVIILLFVCIQMFAQELLAAYNAVLRSGTENP